MTTAPVFADAEGVLRDWIIGQAIEVPSLPGRPFKALLEQPGGKTPLGGAYVYLTAGRGDDSFMAGAGVLQTVNGQVYGPTRKAAVDAAIAYADALRSLYAGNVLVEETDGRPAVRLGLDSVTTPLWAPDRSTPRYLVDATLVITPAA